MTLEEMLESNIGSIAFDSIGKLFDCGGNIYEAMFINDNGEVVLQDICSSDSFYTPSIMRFIERLKSGEYAEYVREVSA